MGIRSLARLALIPLFAGTACGSTYSGAIDADAGAGDGGTMSNSLTDAGDGGEGGPQVLPECTAQRLVYLVGGNAGLAHFTLQWPPPQAVEMPDPTYALDSASNYVKVTTDPAHELYARTTNGVPLFQGTGKNPLVTAFVANALQVFTLYPTITRLADGIDALGVAAAAQQAALAPTLTVVNIDGIVYTAIPGGPTPLDASGGIDAAEKVASYAQLSDATSLSPDALKVKTWTGANATAAQTAIAQDLLFAANAFRQNRIATLLMPAFDDRPQKLWASGTADATTDATTLEGILNAFYDELAKYAEPSCGHNGAPLSLVDNVVLVVSGDTPLDPYQAASWPSATPGGGNILYIRSNGFVKPGWFGALTPTATTEFDPVTGLLDPTSTTDGPSTEAALGGLLYAILRGDTETVARSGVGAYAGVVTSSTP